MSAGFGLFCHPRQQRLRRARDAEEREERALSSFGRGSHLEYVVVCTERDVKLAAFEMSLQHDALVSQRVDRFYFER